MSSALPPPTVPPPPACLLLGSAIELQSGRFDHADRLFHSVAEAWQSCNTSLADVKELTPEFFYLPAFLENSGGFELGVRQDGKVVGDVVLPPWA